MLVEMYIEIDDFCKSNPEILNTWSNKKNKRVRVPRLTLSEIMTIMIHYHQKSFKHFKGYYKEYVQKELKSDFPDLVSYNRFVELVPRAIPAMVLFLNHRCQLSQRTGIYYIDSAPWKVCHPKRAHSHKVMRGFAAWGKTSVGWFFGLKYHLIINHLGEIMSFYISAGNISDSNAKVLFMLTKGLSGWIFGDKGYLLNDAKKDLLEKNRLLNIFAKCRRNMKKSEIPFQAKFWSKKRGTIESVIGLTKSESDAEHSRSRSPANGVANLLSALTAYSFRKTKPHTSINFETRLIQMPIAA